MDARQRLADARLYLCTGLRPDLADFLDAALAGGVDVVQLREKHLEARPEIAAAELMADACRRYGALFSINDRADVAYAVRPDILHLGQDDLPVPLARAILGDDMLIGRSTHAEPEVDAAAVEPGVDYFCVGPTWATPTKPGRPAPGLGLTSYAAATGSVRPWFAIGGIDLDNLDAVLAAGARRVVVVRAITEAADPQAAAAEFTRRLGAAGGAVGDSAVTGGAVSGGAVSGGAVTSGAVTGGAVTGGAVSGSAAAVSAAEGSAAAGSAAEGSAVSG